MRDETGAEKPGVDSMRTRRFQLRTFKNTLHCPERTSCFTIAIYSSQYSNQTRGGETFSVKQYQLSYAEPGYFAYAGWKREGGEQT